MRDFQAPGRSAVYANNVMAATSHPLATQAALEILHAGGNAADAAVAAVAVQCVVEPHMTGIGGDCFAIVAKPDGSLSGLNGSGRAPKAASSAKLRDLGLSSIEATSPHAVTVPGAVRGWEKLLANFGKKNLAQVLGRAIDYAENGFPVAPRLGRDWVKAEAKLSLDSAASANYLFAGKAPLVGQKVRLPALAETLRAIADGGADAFYTGAIARDIVDTLAARGGVMSEEDLAECDAVDVAPITSNYRGVTLAELPPNGQGFIALIMLGLLQRFDVDKLDPLGAERFNLQLEAGRLAYSVRDQFLADPDHMLHDAKTLLQSDYLDRLAAKMSPNSRIPGIPPATLAPNSDTVYLTVTDKDGMAVSLINSLFKDFGSGICAPKSGVMLQNRGSCFRVEPGHVNTIEGGKRPLHTIIPAMALKDGKPWLSFGVMGGAYQPCGHTHVLSNITDYGMDVQEAIDAPRMFFDEKTHQLHAETHVPQETVNALRAIGHDVVRVDDPIGGAQAIMIDRKNGCLIGGSDPRKDGMAAGV